MSDAHIETGPAHAVSHLSESLAQTAQSHRAFVTQIATFTKDESLRFANLRMDRNSQVLEKLQNAQGLPGLIGLQQEWLRDLFSDYADLGQRNASVFRGVAQTVVAKAADATSETVDHLHANAQEGVHQGAQAMSDAQDHVDAAVQDAGDQVSEYGQDANTYVQH